MGSVTDSVLCEGQKKLAEALVKKGCFRFSDALWYVKPLSQDEVEYLQGVVDDSHGEYFHTALGRYRTKKQIDAIDQSFVAGQDGLVATNAALVEQNRHRAL